MRRLPLFSTALLAGALLTGTAAPVLAAPSVEPTSAVVKGVVRNSAGTPVPNVTVVPRFESFAGKIATRTDSQGRYAVRVSFAKDSDFRQVNVCAAGETARNVTPTVSPTATDLRYNTHCTLEQVDLPSAPTHTVDLTIYRRSVLSGSVKDAKGAPVAGARVVGCPTPRGGMGGTPDRGDVTMTNENGRYTLSMPAGGTALSVSKTGYRTFLWDGVACGGPFTSDPPLVLKLEKNLTGVDVILLKKAGTTP